MAKKVYAIRIDDEMREELEKIAEEENRPMSNLIITILKKYLEERAD